MINMDNVMGLMKPPPVDDSPIDLSQNTIKLPLLGRLHFINDKQGKMYLSFVVAYWIYGTWSVYFIILEPAYNDNLIPAAVVFGYLAVAFLCLFSLFRATFTNPGTVPSLTNADSTWNQCRSCDRMRPLRAHHCRRCGQCVMRMDHHCPWINNCVGEANHFAFVQLLAYACLLSFCSLVMLLLHFWVFPKCVSCNKEAFYIKHSIWIMYISVLLSFNMFFLMMTQCSQQHFNLLLNRTTLETMSMDQTQTLQARKCYNAYRELCGHGRPIFWLFPFGRRKPLLPFQLV